MKIEKNDIEKLRGLEESLWIAKTRFDQEYMNKILSPDFFDLADRVKFTVDKKQLMPFLKR